MPLRRRRLSRVAHLSVTEAAAVDDGEVSLEAKMVRVCYVLHRICPLGGGSNYIQPKIFFRKVLD
jgi:hypothetical protein